MDEKEKLKGIIGFQQQQIVGVSPWLLSVWDELGAERKAPSLDVHPWGLFVRGHRGNSVTLDRGAVPGRRRDRVSGCLLPRWQAGDRRDPTDGNWHRSADPPAPAGDMIK